jgi:hypothetical protein
MNFEDATIKHVTGKDPSQRLRDLEDRVAMLEELARLLCDNRREHAKNLRAAWDSTCIKVAT